LVATACGATTKIDDAGAPGGEDGGGALLDSAAAEGGPDAPPDAACASGASTVEGELGFPVVSALEGMATDFTGQTYLEVDLYSIPLACGGCKTTYRRVQIQLYATAGAVAPGTYSIASVGNGTQGRVYFRDWSGDCSGDGGGFDTAATGTIQLTDNNSAGVRGTYQISFTANDGGSVVLSGAFDTSCACHGL
jgi:hypothetical protein